MKHQETAICEICSGSSNYFATALLRRKYEIRYYQCGNCGFTQTECPYWLDEAYSEAITSSDVGLVSRNLALAKTSRALIWAFFDTSASFLDYGGGYGLFVRLMRDSGLNFYLHEDRCHNLFAEGFDVQSRGPGPYELVTAFEVFEHFVHPIRELEKMLRFSPSVLLTTALIPERNPKPDQWWYYGLEHGQHVSFYTARSLSAIAGRFGLNLVSDGSSIHMLSTKHVAPTLFKLLTKPTIAAAVGILARQRSLVPQDYFRVTGRTLE